jgi:hypothetical protein
MNFASLGQPSIGGMLEFGNSAQLGMLNGYRFEESLGTARPHLRCSDRAHFLAYALKAVQQHGEASQVTLIHHDYQNQQHFIIGANVMPSEVQRNYEAHYAALDGWTIAAAKRAPGWQGHGDELWPESEMMHSESYNDFLRPLNLHHLFGSQVPSGVNGLISVALIRPRSAGQFEQRTTELYAILMPHVRRALEMQSRFGSLSALNSHFSSLLSTQSSAILLLDGHGNLIFQNAPAETLLSRDDGVFVRGQRLKTGDHKSTIQMEALIASCLTTGNGKQGGTGGDCKSSVVAAQHPFTRLCPHDASLVVQAPSLLAPPSSLPIPDLAPLAAGPIDPHSTDAEDEQVLPPLRNSGSEFAVRDRTPIGDEEPELSVKNHHATKWRKVAGVAAVAAAAILLRRPDTDDELKPHASTTRSR